FREALHPKAAYLLLDGLSNGGHKHLDGNSLPRLTQFERIWLADNDYMKAQVKYHNSVLVFKDGTATDIPAYTELVGAGETARYGFSRTRLSGYSGADWDRAVVWLKEQKAFVVLDRLTARETGEYQFRLLWHGVGECVPSTDGMLLRQQGPSLRVQVAPGPQVSVSDDPDLGRNWAGYPYADPVVRSMTALATVNLKAGESYLYATALHGTPRGDAKAWKISFLTGEGVLVETERQRIAISLAGLAGTAAGSLQSDAAVVVLDNRALTLLGATQAALAGATLHRSNQAACVEKPLRTAPELLRRLALRPPVPNRQLGGTAAAHPVVWTRRLTMDQLVLTANREVPGSVDLGVKLTAVPRPAKANVFAPNDPNRLDALFDGPGGRGTANSVMWDPDQTVTLTLDLGRPCALAAVRWWQWWSTTSSKKTAYILERAVVSVSSDGFRADKRELGVVTDPGPHPNFGTPIEYAVTARDAVARYVRLTLQPKAGTAVYLAE
ncbi:MAG: hypothetical protein QHJ73_18490, partial [Armatimonadota bacterium]|nr:hypothetical protein [Armatimonadota bacterium]